MIGGTSPSKQEGHLVWKDGTKTKVLIKGSRPGEAKPASFREALFQSRLVDEMAASGLPTFSDYLSVADMSTGQSLQVMDFLNGYKSL